LHQSRSLKHHSFKSARDKIQNYYLSDNVRFCVVTPNAFFIVFIYIKPNLLNMIVDDNIDALDLARHPEGVFYRQTWVNTATDGRPSGTCIYFLRKLGMASHWHRVDAVEICHYHAGASLILSVSKTVSGPKIEHRLGPDI